MTRARVARDAHRRMLNHAHRVARDNGAEAIGWLLGYFAPGEVTVLDVAPATRYRRQSRYGAEADPREELELAASYPRAVGIVGLYHSHPFRDETEHAIFHSETDDRTLRSRASRRKEYLSVVTDGREAEAFVLDPDRTAVEPEVVDGLSYRDALRRLAADVSLRIVDDVDLVGMDGLLAAAEKLVARAVVQAIRDRDATVDLDAGAVRIPRLAGDAKRNVVRVDPTRGGARIALEIRLRAVVYLPRGSEPEVLRILKEEIEDDIVYLLWHGLAPDAIRGPVAALEADLGSLRVNETNPLPRRVYRRGTSRTVLKRAP